MSDENTNKPPEEEKDEPLKPACPLTVKGANIVIQAIHACFQLGGLQHAPKGAQGVAEKLSEWIQAMEKKEED